MRRDAVGLQVSLDVEGRRALVLGGGDEAADKATRLLDGGATVLVLARRPEAAITGLAGAGRLLLLQRDCSPADVRAADLVLVCERDPALAAQVYELARGEGAALWCADDPAHSDFAMPALARAGRVRIAISTSGGAPALASRLRQLFERDLDERFTRFVDQLAAERARLLDCEPDEATRRAQLQALVAGLELTLAIRYPTPAR